MPTGKRLTHRHTVTFQSDPGPVNHSLLAILLSDEVHKMSSVDPRPSLPSGGRWWCMYNNQLLITHCVMWQAAASKSLQIPKMIVAGENYILCLDLGGQSGEQIWC